MGNPSLFPVYHSRLAGTACVIASSLLQGGRLYDPIFAHELRTVQSIVVERREEILEAGMSFSASAADERVLDVQSTDDTLSVSLRDGRVIAVPLVWYPRLLNATPAQRKNWKIAGGGYGIHWPDLDEDLSTEGLLRGAPAPKASVHSK